MSEFRGTVIEVWEPWWIIAKPKRKKAHTRAIYVVLEAQQEGPNIFVFGPSTLAECRRFCRIHQGIQIALDNQNRRGA